MAVDPRLLEILQCPNCSGALLEGGDALACHSCNNTYPLVGGIPDLRVYASIAHAGAFNEYQARYEAELHDAQAEALYEQHVVEVYGTKTRMICQDWAREAQPLPAHLCLDYGCGTGQVSRVISRQVRPLFAFDISEVSVRKNVGENGVVGVLANALFLPFKDRAFDVVYVNGVLHHVVDLDSAIDELARVTERLVCVSEGTPRAPLRSLSTVMRYPTVGARCAYALYVVLHVPMTALARALRSLHRAGSARRVDQGQEPAAGRSHSEHERPLRVDQVESRIQANHFSRRRLRWFTNIDYKGDGMAKRWLTRVLVNGVTGTHFDLIMEREPAGRAPSVDVDRPNPSE